MMNKETYFILNYLIDKKTTDIYMEASLCHPFDMRYYLSVCKTQCWCWENYFFKEARNSYSKLYKIVASLQLKLLFLKSC